MKAYALKDSGWCLRYHDLPGPETPVIFLHGLGCAGSMDYPEVAAQPPLSGHRRIIIDLLGCGFSDKPMDFDYTVAAHARYLLEFIASLNPGSFILFGHSLGGAVALSLAALHPPGLDRLILAESNLDAGGGATSRAITAYSLEEFVSRGFSELIAENIREGNHMWAANLSAASPVAIHRWAQSAIDGVSPSWREILHTLDCPKTYIFAEKTLPDEWLPELESQGIHIEIVPDAGHLMALDNPPGLAAAIRNGISYEEA
jgi:pimeloyl-ACP methyl ester carboxylesterase